MIGKLNHVGVATPSIEESWKLYREMFGATDITEKRALPEQGVWVSFVNLPNAQIELIEPYGEDFADPRLPGQEPRRAASTTSASRLPDIIAARDELRAKGATILGTGEPRIGAHGVPVIFVHPKDMGGVLVELMAEPTGRTDHEPGQPASPIYLTIWWTVLFAVLPLGVRSHAEEGIAVPGGGDPGSPVEPQPEAQVHHHHLGGGDRLRRAVARRSISISIRLPSEPRA